jgi:thioredoxin 1
VDVDQAPSTAAAHRITGVPTLMFYRNGQVVDQIVGVAPLPVLRQKLDLLVASEGATA